MGKIKFIHYFVTLLIIYSVLQFFREPESVELKFLEELKVIENEEEIIVEKKKKSSNVLNKLVFIIIPLAIILFFIILKIFSPRTLSYVSETPRSRRKATSSSNTPDDYSNDSLRNDNISQVSSISSYFSNTQEDYYRDSQTQQQQTGLPSDLQTSQNQSNNSPYTNYQINQWSKQFQKKLRIETPTLFLYGNDNEIHEILLSKEKIYQGSGKKLTYRTYLKRKNLTVLQLKIQKVWEYIKKTEIYKNVVIKDVKNIRNDEKIKHIFLVSMPLPTDNPSEIQNYYTKLWEIVDRNIHHEGASVYLTHSYSNDPRLTNPAIVNLHFDWVRNYLLKVFVKKISKLDTEDEGSELDTEDEKKNSKKLGRLELLHVPNDDRKGDFSRVKNYLKINEGKKLFQNK